VPDDYYTKVLLSMRRGHSHLVGRTLSGRVKAVTECSRWAPDGGFLGDRTQAERDSLKARRLCRECARLTGTTT
jgi:hypothetical protein